MRLKYLIFAFALLFCVSFVVAEDCSNVGEVNYASGEYCDVNLNWTDLKADFSVCVNDFECGNESCIDGVCQQRYGGFNETRFWLEAVWMKIRGWECFDNETKCEGTLYSICGINRVWENKGNSVICGYNPDTPHSCFPAGTSVLMVDFSDKNIEEVRVGDFVFGYNIETNEKVVEEVLELESPIREHMCELTFEDSFLELTNEHPIYTLKGWKSINPFETANENPDLFVGELEIGDEVLFVNGFSKLKDINCWEETLQTYNLKSVSGYNNYFAENVLVHNKGTSRCTPNWNCTDYSNLVSNVKCGFRTCVDKNNCRTTTGKPITYLECPGVIINPYCGDGICNNNEDYDTCSRDCAGFCGDGVCDPTESSATCPAECEALPNDNPDWLWLFILLIILLLIAIGIVTYFLFKKFKENEEDNERMSFGKMPPRGPGTPPARVSPRMNVRPAFSARPAPVVRR